MFWRPILRLSRVHFLIRLFWNPAGRWAWRHPLSDGEPEARRSAVYSHQGLCGEGWTEVLILTGLDPNVSLLLFGFTFWSQSTVLMPSLASCPFSVEIRRTRGALRDVRGQCWYTPPWMAPKPVTCLLAMIHGPALISDGSLAAATAQAKRLHQADTPSSWHCEMSSSARDVIIFLVFTFGWAKSGSLRAVPRPTAGRVQTHRHLGKPIPCFALSFLGSRLFDAESASWIAVLFVWVWERDAGWDLGGSPLALAPALEPSLIRLYPRAPGLQEPGAVPAVSSWDSLMKVNGPPVRVIPMN